MNLRLYAGVYVMIVAFGVAPTVWGDTNSNGPNGTNATATGLNGSGVVVGQLEGGRPPSFATVGDTTNVNADVTLTGVYTAISPVPGIFQNFDQTNHATAVAGTIISTDAGDASLGAATGAQLYSGDIFANSDETIDTSAGNYRNAILTGQRLDTTAGMKAVNMSFGFRYGAAGATETLPSTDFTNLNGTNQFTQYVDWSASRYNVVNVVAGNETGASIGADVPTDSFNGITVSAAAVGVGGRYTSVASFNVVDRLPTDGRLSTVDLMAPGAGLNIQQLGNTYATGGGGTSYAAPQVTAAVALLSQNATQQNMGSDAQQHNVMKAVLMNSVDTVQGILGMDRTITRSVTFDQLGTDEDTATVPESGMNWLQARDYEVAHGINRNANPLDTQMGTGELNNVRAQTQLNAGEQHPGPVNYIGWDYNKFLGNETGAQAHYSLPKLSDGAWVTATLSWDRNITLNDTADGGTANTYDAETYYDTNAAGHVSDQYDNGVANPPAEPLLDLNGNNAFDAASDSFSVAGLNNLDLYLVPVGDTDMADYIQVSDFAASDSTDYSVEHLLFQVPDDQSFEDNPGMYDLVVVATGLDEDLGTQNYGLAWWTEVPEPASVTVLIAGGAMLLARRRRSA